MNTQKKLIGILLLILTIISLIPGLYIYANEPNFIINITESTDISKEISVGDIVSVDFSIENALQNQHSMEVAITYDKTKLEPISDGKDISGLSIYTAGETGSINSDIADGGNIVGTTIENLNGKEAILLSYSFNKEENKYIVSSGKLATIKFRVIATGESTINYNYIKYSTYEGNNLKETLFENFSNSITVKGIVPMTGLELNSSSKTINKNEKFTLIPTKKPENTTDNTDITWTSSDINIATVKNGVVTAKKGGQATITAMCGEFQASCVINVEVPLTRINITRSSVGLNINNNLELLVSKYPSDTTDKTEIVWTSSDESIVKILSPGKIKTVGRGTATITATCGEFSDTCEVTVYIPITGVKIDKTTATINKGETLQLTGTKLPLDTNVTTPLTWISSDETIAVVDQNGLVTGVSKGEVTITAQANKYHKAKCTVTVNAPIESIEITNGDIDLYKGQIETLNVLYNPTDFTGSGVIMWNSTNPDVAIIENGTVTALSQGTTEIIVETANGKTDSITVTVKEIKATTLVINKKDIIIEKGETETLTATVLPENTTDDKTITWTSKNPDIATIENGVITAKAPGKTVIVAKSGDLTSTCNVTVKSSLKSITLDKTRLDLEAGDIYNKLVVSLNPTDATVKREDIIWESGNNTVATVKNGVVTAVGPGSAVITAMLDGKSASCLVDVKVTLTGVKIEDNFKTLKLTKNQTSELKVNYIPSNPTIVPTPVWSSSDESIVSVDNKGNIKALEIGTAIITVDYGNGIKSSRKIKVYENPATGIKITKKVEIMFKGYTEKFEVEITPSDTTDNIIWSSSNEDVAVVDNDGTVKALKVGKTVITVSCGNLHYDMEIQVKEKKSIKAIKLTTESNSILEGDSTQIKVECIPTDTTDEKNFIFKSSNTSIAEVDKNGKVTAKKAGKLIVTVIAENGVTSQINLRVIERVNDVGAIPTIPQTGDINVIGLVCLMIISIIGMIIIIINRKIKKTE